MNDPYGRRVDYQVHQDALDRIVSLEQTLEEIKEHSSPGYTAGMASDILADIYKMVKDALKEGR